MGLPSSLLATQGGGLKFLSSLSSRLRSCCQTQSNESPSFRPTSPGDLPDYWGLLSRDLWPIIFFCFFVFRKAGFPEIFHYFVPRRELVIFEIRLCICICLLGLMRVVFYQFLNRTKQWVNVSIVLSC